MYKKGICILVIGYVVLLASVFCTMRKSGLVREEKAVATCVQGEWIGIVRYSSSDCRVMECGTLNKEDVEYEKERVEEGEDEKEMEIDAVISFSEEEVEVLRRIVEAEAGGEDETGKLLVANVVLNRVKSEAFPDTIKEVVFQQSNGIIQFSPVKNGRYDEVTVSEETIHAVDRALEGEDESEGALYFASRKYANKKSMRWFDDNLLFLFRHGGHEFFK